MENYQPVLNWIETQKLTILDRLSNWVNINTHTENVEGLQELVQKMRDDFHGLRGDFHVLFLGPFQKPAIRIQKRPSSKTKVLLCGHLDTVFVKNSPFQTIQKQSDEILIGPGIVDMKGGIAILLTALEALENSAFSKDIGWEVLLIPDEEIGSPDSISQLQQAAKRNDLALVFEPGFPDGAFASERMGSTNIRLQVKGKAAHAGRDYKSGKSAVFPLCKLLTGLESHCKKEEIIVNASHFDIATPLNIVTPTASCLINLRSYQESQLDIAIEKIKKLIVEEETDGISIEIHILSFRPPKLMNEQSLALFEAYQSCSSMLGMPFLLRETGGVCDGNILAKEGIAVLDSAGAIGGGLHTDSEYLLVESLISRSKLAALFLMRLANGEFTLGQWRQHDR